MRPTGHNLLNVIPLTIIPLTYPVIGPHGSIIAMDIEEFVASRAIA